MADIQITGNSTSAVNALAAFTRASKQARGEWNVLKTTIKSGNMFLGTETKVVSLAQQYKTLKMELRATAEAQGLFIAKQQLASVAANKHAEALLRSVPALRRARLEAVQYVRELQKRDKTKGFDTNQTTKLDTLYTKLQNKMRDLGISGKRVDAVMKQVFDGKRVASMNERMRAIIPIIQQIRAVDLQRISDVDRLTAKLRQQKAEYLKIQRAKLSGTRAGQFTGSIRVAAPTATASELLAYDKSEAALTKLLAKARFTTKEMKRLHKEAATDSARRYGDIRDAAIRAFRAISIAQARLGAQARREAASAAAAQKRFWTSASTSYSSADRGLKTLILSWRSITRLASIQVLHLAYGRLIQTVFEANRNMIDLSVSIGEIRTISSEAQLSTARWTDEVIRLSSAFGKTTADVAEGVYQTLSNQIAKGTEATAFLTTALIFSRTAVASTADAANLLSSSLNSFGDSAVFAERAAAQLFTTIEFGRVRASEMANTYGRVAAMAHQLTIEQAELNAMIAVISIRGIKYNEAFTLINNVMLKILRPTENMSKLFAKWGVTSGVAAIKTFGFIGVLQKLEEHTSSSSDSLAELGELFSRLRAIRGGAFLTDPTILKELEERYSDITNSTNRYAAAAKEAFDVTGFTIQKAIQQFKNYILKNISEPVIEWAANSVKAGTSFVTMLNQVRAGFSPFIKTFGLFIAVMRKFGFSVTRVITLFITFKVVSRLAAYAGTTAFKVYSAQLLKTNVRLKALNLSLDQAKWAATAMSTAMTFGLAAVATVLTTVILRHYQLREEIRLASIEASDATIEYTKRLFAEEAKRTDFTKTQTEKRKEIIKKALEASYNLSLRLSASIGQQVNSMYAELAKALTNAVSRMNNAISEMTSDLRAGLSELKKDLKKAEDAIANTEKDLTKLGKEKRKELFEFSFANLERPKEQLKALAEQIKLISKIKATSPVDALSLEGERYALLKRQAQIIRSAGKSRRATALALQQIEEKILKSFERRELLRKGLATKAKRDVGGLTTQVHARKDLNASLADAFDRLKNLKPDIDSTPNQVSDLMRDFKSELTNIQTLLGSKDKKGRPIVAEQDLKLFNARVKELQVFQDQALALAQLSKAQKELAGLTQKMNDAQEKALTLREEEIQKNTNKLKELATPGGLLPGLAESISKILNVKQAAFPDAAPNTFALSPRGPQGRYDWDRERPLIEGIRKIFGKDVPLEAKGVGVFGERTVLVSLNDQVIKFRDAVAKMEESPNSVNSLAVIDSAEKFAKFFDLMKGLSAPGVQAPDGTITGRATLETGTSKEIAESKTAISDVIEAQISSILKLTSARLKGQEKIAEITAFAKTLKKQETALKEQLKLIKQNLNMEMKTFEQRKTLIETLQHLNDNLEDFMMNIPRLIDPPPRPTFSPGGSMTSNTTNNSNSITITVDGSKSPTQTAKAIAIEINRLVHNGQIATA